MACENKAPSSPAAERNKEPILARLEGLLPRWGRVLEIASGTGQHVMHFAAALPALEWQPSEADAEALEWIRLRRAAAGLNNVALPLRLDVLERPWPIERADAVLNVNLIHIAPWEVAEALIDGAAALLEPRAPLILYGPFRREGRHTAPSNEAFDTSLRRRDPRWGVRDLEVVEAHAQRAGFETAEIAEMPANNLLVAFLRR